MMADAIVVLKDILYDLILSFFNKVQKGELMKYALRIKVLT